MKKKLLLGIILFSFTTSILSQDIEEIMKNGNLAFQNKQYSEAISQYQSIIKQGYISSDLFYNLGNAYFKTNNLGKAILYYEKALKLSPLSEDAKHNLKIANSRTIDKIKIIPKLFIFEWWDIILTSFTTIGWQIIVIIFYILFLLCIGIYYLVKNIQFQRIAFIFGFFSLATLIFSIILFVSSLSRTSSSNYGILQNSVISSKISPDEKSNDAFVIHEGSKFLIEDEVNNWVKIKLADGKVGWLPNNSFEII